MTTRLGRLPGLSFASPRTSAVVLIFTQKAVLDLRIDLVQPLLRARRIRAVQSREYASGRRRTVEAEAALRAATRANASFAEAWYNLADLLDDQGRCEAAVECLRKTLVAAPEYIDAMFNLALLLQRKGAFAEAADYWRRYLVSDRASEWAVRARRSLKFCDIQMNSLRRPGRQVGSDQAA